MAFNEEMIAKLLLKAKSDSVPRVIQNSQYKEQRQTQVPRHPLYSAEGQKGLHFFSLGPHKKKN